MPMPWLMPWPMSMPWPMTKPTPMQSMMSVTITCPVLSSLESKNIKMGAHFMYVPAMPGPSSLCICLDPCPCPCALGRWPLPLLSFFEQKIERMGPHSMPESGLGHAQVVSVLQPTPPHLALCSCPTRPWPAAGPATSIRRWCQHPSIRWPLLPAH